MAQQDYWRELSELFNAALDRPASERRAWVEDACSGRSELATELMEMLGAHERAGILDTTPQLLDELDKTDTTADRVASKIGPYRIAEELGRGGMGIVYKAKDERLDRFVALKFLSRELARSPQGRDFFLLEARAASALDHPNICTVYDVGETEDGAFYIAMAYCDGETLAQRMKHSRFTIRECIEIATAIAEGLGCAHESGIVHRDIKPSNIGITHRGEVKILDFGVAQLERGDPVAINGRVGTVAYAAPEQLRGDDVSTRADVWSLGVVLYEMLTGSRPFSSEGSGEIAAIWNVLNSAPAQISGSRHDIPRELEAVVLKALSKQPESRFRDGREFAAALSACRLDAAGHDVPVPLTSFIGRHEELSRARSLLEKVRLLTFTGPGGTGKTRLAIELAHMLAREFRDGVRFVPLSAITDPRLVLRAVAESLGVFRRDAPTARIIIDAVQQREILLVLDNFEQVVSAAPLVSEMLAGAPGLKLIVTSRIPLHVEGEHEMPVPPLRVSDSGPAQQLFTERARATAPDFMANGDSMEAIAEICRRLDGLPLAIELAAARVKYLTPQAMLVRLGNRLDLLNSGGRDRPPRHQTLRQALAWSYDLLEEDHRRVFRRAGVFVNGFTPEALEFVCSSFTDAACGGLEAVFTLVDQSLVARADGPQHEARFYLLETMREYALELLARSNEEEQARDAHAQWYVELCQRGAEALTGNEQGIWLKRLDADHDNIRAALHWLSDRRKIAEALRLATGVWRFWISRGYHREGRGWLERLMKQASSDVSATLRADALNGCGTLAHGSSDLDGAKELLEQALALYREAGNQDGVGLALNNLSWILVEVGRFEEARAMAREAYRTHEQTGNLRGLAVALNNMAWIGCYTSAFDDARTLHQRSIEFRRQAGDSRGEAFGLTNLAWAEQLAGRYQESLERVDQAMQLLNSLNDEVLMAWAVQQRAAVMYETEQYEEAASQILPVLPVWRRMGNSSGLAFGVYYAVLALLRMGDVERAARVLEEGKADLGSSPPAWGGAMLESAQAFVKAAQGNGDAPVATCEAAAAALSAVGDTRTLASTLELMAELTAAMDPLRASAALEEARQIRRRIHVPVPPCDRARVERAEAMLAAT